MRFSLRILSALATGGALFWVSDFTSAARAQTASEATLAPTPTPTPQVRVVSLEEAISMALDRGESIRRARAGLAVALADDRRANAQRLPRFDGRFGYSRTLASEFEDVDFDFGDPGGGGGSDLSELPFGQENRYEAGVAGSQVLYAGGRVVAATKATRAGISAAEVGVETARALLTLEVVAAYFDSALADNLVLVREQSVEQAERTYQQAKSAFDVGDAAEFDVLRAQVSRDNERPGLLTQRSLRNLAHLRLKQLLDLPADQPIRLATVAPQATLFEVPEGETAESVALSRAPVREAEALTKLREALVGVAVGARRPAIDLLTDYGRVAYPSSGVPSWNDTRDNWTVGIGLRVPLFNGGALRADIAAAEAEVDGARATLDQTRKLALLEARDVFERLDTAIETWRVSEGVVEQARRAFDIAEVRYREGISTQLELDNSRLLLVQAQGNRALAARDLEVAKARRALLPELPLGVLSLFDRLGGR